MTRILGGHVFLMALEFPTYRGNPAYGLSEKDPIADFSALFFIYVPFAVPSER